MSTPLTQELPPSFDPHVAYSSWNYPPPDEQQNFFWYALLETRTLPDTTRHRCGPLITPFTSVLRETNRQLHALDPSLTSAHLVPETYQDPRIRTELRAKPPDVTRGIYDIRQYRATATEQLVETSIIGRLAPQTIPTGLLDTPPYCLQGDGDPNNKHAQMACANACFRMVFGGISGWVPKETAVNQELIRWFGTPVVDDPVYHKIFQTDIFSEISPSTVRVTEIIGADFATITQGVRRIKGRAPSVQVFCVASLGSETVTRDVWHTNVVLGTTATSVICHDPSDKKGQPHKPIPKEDFVHRWARALNRVQLFVAI